MNKETTFFNGSGKLLAVSTIERSALVNSANTPSNPAPKEIFRLSTAPCNLRSSKA